MIDQEKHRQAGLKAYAHEMETLKEGTWYIRGCSELRDYFDKIECNFDGHISTNGYYIEKGKWDWDNIDYLQHRKEITLQDYLDSLKPQSFDELDSEFEEKERSAIEFLKSRGYLVTKLFEDGEEETSLQIALKALENIVKSQLKDGESLNGHYAIMISDKPKFYQDIAKEALEKINSK